MKHPDVSTAVSTDNSAADNSADITADASAARPPRSLPLPSDHALCLPGKLSEERAPALRLLYVQPAEVFGGAERQGVLHMAGLGRHGFEVVPVVGPGTMILPELAALGVKDPVHLQRFPHERYYPAAFLGKVVDGLEFARDWLSAQRRLHQICEERQIDMILANRSTGWIAASYTAHRLELPLVWRGGGRLTSRGEAAFLELLGSWFRPDLFIANCEAVRQAVGDHVDCPSCVVENGVDHRRFDPQCVAPDLRAELGIAPAAPVIGFPSRPAPEKGLDLFAEAVARVAGQVPGLTVVMAGEFGWREHYERLFRELHVGARVVFLGHVQQVERVYRISDVVALSSPARSIEGSPNTLLEAMAMQCPVVATNVGGVAEAVSDGVEGLLVPAADATALGAALLALLRDPALRRRMGAAGRATIQRRFSSEVVVARLADLLRQTAAGRSSGPAGGRLPRVDVAARGHSPRVDVAARHAQRARLPGRGAPAPAGGDRPARSALDAEGSSSRPRRPRPASPRARLEPASSPEPSARVAPHGERGSCTGFEACETCVLDSTSKRAMLDAHSRIGGAP